MEIRALRQQLEISIKRNDKLREQLDKNMKVPPSSAGSESSVINICCCIKNASVLWYNPICRTKKNDENNKRKQNEKVELNKPNNLLFKTFTRWNHQHLFAKW